MTIEENNKPVALNIRKIIAISGIKQKTVAQKAGISESSLGAMLNGRKIIKAADILNIAVALGVSPADLFHKNNW